MTSSKQQPTVAVTRDEPAGGKLSRLFADAGYRVLNWPVITTYTVDDTSAAENAVRRLTKDDWLIMTSPRAVKAFPDFFTGFFPPSRLGIVGNGIVKRLAALGHDVQPDLQCDTADELGRQLKEHVSPNSQVVFLAGSLAPNTATDPVRHICQRLERFDVYMTEFQPLDRDQCQTEIENGFDALSFASASAVDGLHQTLGQTLFDKAMKTCGPVAIGPTTAQAAKARGYECRVAQVRSLDGLFEAVDDFVRERAG